jgi:hypothetical protein
MDQRRKAILVLLNKILKLLVQSNFPQAGVDEYVRALRQADTVKGKYPVYDRLVNQFWLIHTGIERKSPEMVMRNIKLLGELVRDLNHKE